ncbi:hypothetical protein POTOM_058204 [Populus tomentosa]|uniref:THO complex subunit 2 n=1 Tax=Populus tomentosa TaxID=118781 RepID=A0A8X7XUU0_POPTO|nr:hypothetical protein POTOM_058204 [Populus tomentosa]
MSTTLPPMECLYVTEEFLRELKGGNHSFRLPHPVPILRFLYELSWNLVRGELPFQKCKAALDSVEFVDKVSALTMSGEYRSRLIKLAKWLVESALVPLRFFQERCEEEFLWEAEMIKIKAQDLKGKEVRVNTRLLYQQTKFNLLREESEGYAKLVCMICCLVIMLCLVMLRIGVLYQLEVCKGQILLGVTPKNLGEKHSWARVKSTNDRMDAMETSHNARFGRVQVALDSLTKAVLSKCPIDNDLEREREKAFSNQFITKLKEICVTLDVPKQKKNDDEQNVNESKDSKDKVQLAMQMESLFMILILKFIAQNSYYHYCLLQSGSYLMEVTLLYQGSEDTTENTSAATIGIIKSLIGHFDLDPNRVFDIVLEYFELQPDSNVFLELIPIFPKSHASQILGFKFQYYQRIELNSHVPFGLYKLTALLVKEEFIDLDSICAHLLPKDDEAFEHYNTFSSKRLDEANKIGKINLAATGKDLMDDEKQGDVTVDLFAAIDMEAEAVAERFSELENNQTLGLLTGFLSVDDWYHAHILFERLSPLNPVAHSQICNGLFRLIEKLVSSTYNIIRQTHIQSCGSPRIAGMDAMGMTGSSGHVSFIDLPKEFFQMVVTVGPYLYRDTLLLHKVCRVLRGYYMSALELVDSGDGAQNGELLIPGNRVPRLHLREARSRVEEALGACLLPSLQLVPANPAVGQEIWEVMNLLPYEVRYRLYGEWEKDDERNPVVLAARQTAKLDTRRILKRLAKENLKQLGRMVAKLAHANPMTVLRTIVHQIESYRDMISPVVDAFKYLTQVTRIKSDEREDLKVLATGVAAALAARKPSWITDEEFGMGYLEIKPPSAASKSLSGNVAAAQNSSALNVSQGEPAEGRAPLTGSQHGDPGNSTKEQISRAKHADGRSDRTDNVSHSKFDQGHQKSKGGSSTNGSNAQSTGSAAAVHVGASRSSENRKGVDDSSNRTLEDGTVRAAPKNVAESEMKISTKRLVSKTPKQDVVKDDNKSGKAVGRTPSSSTSDKDIQVNLSEGRQGGAANVSSALTLNGNAVSTSGKISTLSTRASDSYGAESKSDSGLNKPMPKAEANEVADVQKPPQLVHSPRHDNSVAASKSSDKLQKRASPAEEPDRSSKRRKGDGELRDLEGEVKFSERERSTDTRSADLDKVGNDEQNKHRSTDKPLDRLKDKVNDRYDRDHRERSERPDKSHGDDSLADRSRDKSMERYGRERSDERGMDRGTDRSFDRLADKAKDDRSKLRYNDTSAEKSQGDDRFHGQNLPPPPPLPPHMVPQSVTSGRRDEDADRRLGTTRHAQRLSPRHDEKERRRSEENSLVSQDDTKRRKEEDVRERKREEREGLSIKSLALLCDKSLLVKQIFLIGAVLMYDISCGLDNIPIVGLHSFWCLALFVAKWLQSSVEEREREREKTHLLKEEMDAGAAAAKRRKIKRDHLPTGEAGEYSPVAPPPPPLGIGMSQSYDGRDRGDRKGGTIQRSSYLEEPSIRIHGKDVAGKMARRDADPYP